MKQKRRLNVHAKLLYDVIFRQAGSLAKAILEGIMNSVDAGAKTCEIVCVTNSVRIEDDGSGILGMEQIEKFFETFGQPHDESERKIYGTFRIGRGQLFSYGRNIWRTGNFEMDVDVKQHGFDYELTQLKEKHEGCRIKVELYEPLSPSDLQHTEDCIRQWAQFAPLTVLWNDEKISEDPGEHEWTHVTDEAYIQLDDSHSLSLYNLGIHTCELGRYQYGCGGSVVTRKQLKVNFARNDVQSDCPVWRKIKPFLTKVTTQRAVKKPLLDDAGRAALAKRLLGGEKSAQQAKLITLVNGRHVSFEQLRNFRFRDTVTVCPKGNRLGDDLMQSQVAVVIATETLERFGVKTLDQLEAKLQRVLPQFSLGKVVDFAVLTKGMREKYTLLPSQKLKVNELIWQEVGSFLENELAWQWSRAGHPYRQRRVCVGEGSADGWTDGQNYIALNRKYLAKLGLGIRGIVALCGLVAHEMCHDEDDTETHVHGADFYQLYHDLSVRFPPPIQRAISALTKAIKRHGKKMPRELLGVLDQEHALRQAKEQVRQLAARHES